MHQRMAALGFVALAVAVSTCLGADDPWAKQFSGELVLKYSTPERVGFGRLASVVDPSLDSAIATTKYAGERGKSGEVTVEKIILKGDVPVATTVFFDHFARLDQTLKREKEANEEIRCELRSVVAGPRQHTLIVYRWRFESGKEQGRIGWHAVRGTDLHCVLVTYTLPHSVPDSFLLEHLDQTPSELDIQKVDLGLWKKNAFEHWANRLESAELDDPVFFDLATGYFIAYEGRAFGLMKAGRYRGPAEEKRQKLDEVIARIRDAAHGVGGD